MLFYQRIIIIVLRACAALVLASAAQAHTYLQQLNATVNGFLLVSQFLGSLLLFLVVLVVVGGASLLFVVFELG